MLNSLYIGATGMQAQQQNVDTIANNLANVNTTGYKKGRVSFSDAFYKMSATSAMGDGRLTGLGTQVRGTTKSFVAGDIKQTGGTLDVAIRGNGFLEVQMPDGSTAYTRHGALQLTKDGLLGTSGGYALKQQIRIPVDATQTVIDATGKVSVQLPNGRDLVEVGQLELANFANSETLDPIGDNLYASSQRSAQIVVVKPGEQGTGTLAQGYLEASNVQLAEEMVNLVLAQRAYELNAKIIQTSDEMLSISNNLRR